MTQTAERPWASNTYHVGNGWAADFVVMQTDGNLVSYAPTAAVAMDTLSFVDEHHLEVRAAPERVWGVLLRLARGRLGRPAPAVFRALWRLDPASGFAVAEEAPPRHLALRGCHRFSRYELVLDVESLPEGAILVARTSALFPGLTGAVYRWLVIRSGGHARVVRWLLAGIARAAEQPIEGTRETSDR